MLLTLPVECQAQSQSHPQIQSVTTIINDNNRRLTNYSNLIIKNKFIYYHFLGSFN